MPRSFLSLELPENYFRRVMSGPEAPGSARGIVPSVLRGVAALAEPFYTAAVARRNRRFDRGATPVFVLPRPVISVGNLSAGGTGKTPVVAHLARELLARGHAPAVLLRGYRALPGQRSDEQAELEQLLGPGVPVVANPDRHAGGLAALRDYPAITCFLLDDGFQHRRLHRDFDLVLVSATQGLCRHRVLPRGLLREPPASLARASAILLTRTDQVPPHDLDALQQDLTPFLTPGTPVYRSAHAPDAVVSPLEPEAPPASLAGRPVFVVVGTADPTAFVRTALSLGAKITGLLSYRDHHPYTPADLAHIHRAARAAGATALLTTGKDAVKLSPLLPQTPPPNGDLPLLTLRIALRLPPDDDRRLTQQLLGVITDKSPLGAKK